MGIVETKNLVYEYIRRDENGEVVGITKAIDQVNLEIQAGEFVAVLGHNGSGKSTFARHLNALLDPTEGQVIIAGMDSAEEKNALPIRQCAGMVFQNPDNQIIGTIVEEDVAFGPENIGIPTDEIWERVGQAIEKVGMSAYRTFSPNRLSGGQKQRVAIAGVLAMKPQCIILDEPTAMLDPLGRKEVMQAVMDLNRQEHVTIILITHHMDEAVLADRVYVMSQGTVQLSGSPKEVFSQVETLKELHLDVPQATELAYLLKKDGISLPDGILTNEELVEAICQLS